MEGSNVSFACTAFPAPVSAPVAMLVSCSHKNLLVKCMTQANFCDNNLCFVYNQLQVAKVMLNLQEKGV